jgi:hypothetical protein
MLGTVGAKGYWSEGVYENTWVKDDGVWKLKDLRYFPTFISDYDLGWGKDAQPVPTASKDLPPDRPPTSVICDLPEGAHPAVPLRQPGERARAVLSGGAWPADGRRDQGDSRTGRREQGRARSRAQQKDVDAVIAQTEQQVGRVKDSTRSTT